MAVVKDEPYSSPIRQAIRNNRKAPGNQAFYTAAKRYAGRDRLAPQGSSPDGGARRVTVDITVR